MRYPCCRCPSPDWTLMGASAVNEDGGRCVYHCNPEDVCWPHDEPLPRGMKHLVTCWETSWTVEKVCLAGNLRERLERWGTCAPLAPDGASTDDVLTTHETLTAYHQKWMAMHRRRLSRTTEENGR